MAIDGAFGVGNLAGGASFGTAEIDVNSPMTYASGGTNATSGPAARHNLLSVGMSGNDIGDIWFRNLANGVTRLPIGDLGYVLTVVQSGANRIPGWRASTGGPGPGDGSGGIGEVPSTPPGYWVRTLGQWVQTIDDGVY